MKKFGLRSCDIHPGLGTCNRNIVSWINGNVCLWKHQKKTRARTKSTDHQAIKMVSTGKSVICIKTRCRWVQQITCTPATAGWQQDTTRHMYLSSSYCPKWKRDSCYKIPKMRKHKARAATSTEIYEEWSQHNNCLLLKGVKGLPKLSSLLPTKEKGWGCNCHLSSTSGQVILPRPPWDTSWCPSVRVWERDYAESTYKS